MANFEFREIAHLSPEYQATVELRDRLLRAPLGLKFTDAELAAECADIHIGEFDPDGHLLACLVLSPESTDTSIRMRQVAVDSELHGQGIGSQLVRHAETIAAGRGFDLITLHARREVTEFYSKLGYTQIGEPFTEVGIPHITMQKAL